MFHQGCCVDELRLIYVNVPQSMFVRAMRKNAINMYKYVRQMEEREQAENGMGQDGELKR